MRIPSPGKTKRVPYGPLLRRAIREELARPKNALLKRASANPDCLGAPRGRLSVVDVSQLQRTGVVLPDRM